MNTGDETERSESWLVLRAQAGDREALDSLFRSIQEPLFRYLQKMVGEPDPARDILQEVLLRVYRKLSWLREPSLFRAWSFRDRDARGLPACRQEAGARETTRCRSGSR